MKRLIILIVIAVIGVQPASCAVPPVQAPTVAATPSEAAVPAEVVERGSIVFWDTMRKEVFDSIQTFVDLCAESGGIDVDHVLMPFDQAREKFATATAAGAGPDVILGPATWLLEPAAKGSLLDITDRVEDAEDYLPAIFTYNVIQGRTWGVPQSISVQALLYNKSLFAETGLDPEHPPVSLDEFGEYAKVLTLPDDGRYGFMLADRARSFQPLLYAFAGSFLDADTADITVDSRESISALDFILALRDQGVMPLVVPDRIDDAVNAFKAGKVAMMFGYPWMAADILNSPEFKPEDLGIALTPEGTDGRGSPVFGSNYALSRETKYPDAAFQFVTCLNQAENQARLAADQTLLPSRRSAYDLPELKENLIVQGFFPQAEIVPREPVISQSELFYPDFDSAFNSVFLGEVSPDEAMASLRQVWKQKLEKSGFWCWDWGVWWCCE